MGIFDKLQFWKKSDDFGDLDKDFGKSMPLGGEFNPNSQSFPSETWNAPGLDQQTSFVQPTSAQPGFGQSAPSQFGSAPSTPSFGAPQNQGYPSQPSFSQQQPFQNQSFSQQSFSSPSYTPVPAAPPHDADYLNSKSLEVISSKLDALRAAVESMNARLANIERIAGQEEDTRRRRYY